MENTLRDELAMSMPYESIPTITSTQAMLEIASSMSVLLDIEDINSMIDFSIKYQSMIRYKYADAMLEAREKTYFEK